MRKSDDRSLQMLFVGAALTVIFAVAAYLGLLFALPWYKEYRELSSLFTELKHADKSKVQKASPVLNVGGRSIQPGSQDEVVTSFVAGLVKREDRAVPWLIAALNDEDDDMRLCAVFALGRIGAKSEPAVPLLLAMMHDENDALRRHAAEALKRIAPKHESVVPVMIAALQDESPAVRWFALAYIKDVGPTARLAVPALTKIVQSTDQTESRVPAMEALGEIGPGAKAAVPALLKAQRDVTYSAEAAARAVRRIGPAAVPALVDALQSGTELSRIYAANLLGRIGPPGVSSVPALIVAIQDQSRDVRYAAVRALGNMGPDARQAMAALAKALHDADSIVRSGTEYSIKQIDHDAWMELRLAGIDQQ